MLLHVRNKSRSLFTGVVIDRKLICILHALLVLSIKQQHCQTGTG